MTKTVTIICSLAFMIAGIMMAITANDLSPGTGYKTIAASTVTELQVPTFPTFVADTGAIDLPEDLVRDLAKRKGIQDTVYITKTDTVPVTKVKVKKVPVPSNVMEINVTKTRTDTIQVPVYYLATQVGKREDPTGKCISVYEVHKVDEICPENIIPSVNSVIMQNINTGE